MLSSGRSTPRGFSHSNFPCLCRLSTKQMLMWALYIRLFSDRINNPLFFGKCLYFARLSRHSFVCCRSCLRLYSFDRRSCSAPSIEMVSCSFCWTCSRVTSVVGTPEGFSDFYSSSGPMLSHVHLKNNEPCSSAHKRAMHSEGLLVSGSLV